MRAGPSTSSMAVGIDHEIIGSTGKARLYASDNLFQGNFRYLADDLDQISVGSPPCPLTVKPVSSEEAYAKVLQAAGAFPRDSFDTRIVSEVRSEEHTSELQSLMRISYAVFCLKK